MVTKAQKEERVATLTDQLSRSQIAIVSDYRGLNVQELTELRRSLQEVGAEITIAKNTLIKRALDKADLPQAESILQGPTALVMGFDDPVAPAKALLKYLKDNKKENPVRGGVFEGKEIAEADIQALAKLPGREELLAKMMGSMQSPAQGVVVTLNGVARNLVGVLAAIQKTKTE